MSLDKCTFEWLEEEYTNKKRSFQDIATELGTYTNAIRRKAIKFGIKIRDKSEAQAEALKSSRHKHPTKGTKRSNEVKVLISEGVSKSWDKLSDEQYDSRVQKSVDQWEAMSDSQKKNIQKKAINAVRKTAKTGSKLEKFILEDLKNAGYLIEFHKKGILSNNQLEVDMFFPTHNIAIEVDGPSHFIEIWGKDSLRKVQKADAEKNGLLLMYKINVIRVQQHRKNLSDKNLRDAAKAVRETIDNITRSDSVAIHNVEIK